MNKITIISVILYTITSWAGYAQNIKNTSSRNMAYHHPTPGEISIMACSPIPDGLMPTKEDYKEIIDCGFNLITSMSSLEYFNSQLDLLEGLELKYVLSIAQLIKNNDFSFLSKINKHPKFGGWLLKDEPSFDFLPTLKDQWNILNEKVPDDFVMINLVGTIEKKFTGPFSSFSEYINYIERNFPLQMWSYDYYPILIKNGKLTINYDQFYYDLETFYNISKKTKRPFWAFCESMEYSTKWYSRPAATTDYLRYEAFSALAYGAQGIVYWTYGMRYSNNIEKYLSALVGLNGKKSKAWYAAQKVNNEIKKYNDVFYESNVLEVKHVGNIHYDNTTDLKGNIGPIRKVIANEQGVIISRMENKGKKYIVIVSRDVLKKQTIYLDLLDKKSIKAISLDKTPQYSWENTIKITFGKGGYLIFEEVD